VAVLRAWKRESGELAQALARPGALVFSDLEGGHLHPERFWRTFRATLTRCRRELGEDAPADDHTARVRFKLIAWCLTWGLCDQLRRLVVLVDHATEDLAPPDRRVQRRAGLAVLVGRSLLTGLVRAVAVVMAGVLAED
jgi:hypothetical protein